MPRRLITDEIRTSKTTSRLSAEARVLMDNLITVADDYGLFEADPVIAYANAFPRRPPWLTGGPDQVARLLLELAAPGMDGDKPIIARYEVDGRLYAQFGTGWRKAQGAPRAKRPRFPTPDDPTATPCSQPARTTPAQRSQDVRTPRANVLASASASASASDPDVGSTTTGALPSGVPLIGRSVAPAPSGAGTTTATAGKKPAAPPKHVSHDTPTEGLDTIDKCRKAWARVWHDEHGGNGAAYPDQPGVDREHVGFVLNYHRRNKLPYPWQDWIWEVFRTYVAIKDDKLVVQSNHALRFLSGCLPRIAPLVAKELDEQAHEPGEAGA